MRTQVAIVGAGPAGLMLAQLLHGLGVESVVLERRSRAYVESRVRAGLLEHGTVELLARMGVDGRLRREALVHHGIELRFDGEGHRIALSELTGGRTVTIYGQQEVVKDLIAARESAGALPRFEVQDVTLDGLDGPRPEVAFTHEGRRERIGCDVVAGCDGFHGVSRAAVPAGVLRERVREYPFAWLGILARVAPSSDELVYASHERGFALHSMRSPEISRLYLQVAPDEDLEAWPDERIWAELATRLARDDGWTLAEGPVIEKGITPMRAYVAWPMRHGRLFLAGDAVHIVPPTGAKGLNLAARDVAVLAEALGDFFASGSQAGLDAYSATCLRRVWRAQDFSTTMTTLLHRLGDDPFERELQRARLRYVTSSEAAARSLAENYVGMDAV